MQEKDLHYFITRIVNPDLNWIVASLRSSRRVLHGRDGYTGVAWRDKTPGDYIADRLEEWRDNLWYKYKRDFPANGKAILDEYFRILYEAESYGISAPALQRLWELAERMGEYLGLPDYVSGMKREIKSEVGVAALEEKERKERKILPENKIGRGEEENKKIPQELLVKLYSPPKDYWRADQPPLTSQQREEVRKEGNWKEEGRSGRKWVVGVVSAVVVMIIVAIVHGGYFLGGNEPSLNVGPLHLGFNKNSCSGQEYSLRGALECYLNNRTMMQALMGLALQLKGSNLEESAWNVVDWEDKHISYDWMRAQEASDNESVPIQTPLQTIRRGKGICVDYAVLTVALLVDMDYSSVYVFDINFSNSRIGHAAAAVKIDGMYFMIDQHPPIEDLRAYWMDWAYWRQWESNGTERNLIISRAVVYEVLKVHNKIAVHRVGVLTAQDFKKEGHTFTQADVQRIVSDLRAMFLNSFPNLHLDEGIANLDNSKYLPSGYSEGNSWVTEFPHFGEYYNPVFHKEFVDYLYQNLVDSKELVADLKKYTCFWLKATTSKNGTLTVVIDLANK